MRTAGIAFMMSALCAAILTPLALAVFLAVMIDGFARVLEHRLAGRLKQISSAVARNGPRRR